MTAEYDAITAHQHSIRQVIPLLEAIRSVAEIAFRRAEARLPPLARYSAGIDAYLAHAPRPVQRSAGAAGPPGRSMLVVISSERGLCGAFNQRLVSRARTELRSRRAASEGVDLVCLGRRGWRLLDEAKEPILHWSPLASFALPVYLDIEKEAIDILDLMESRACGRLLVMHNSPLHRFQYQTIVRQLFPIEFPPLSAEAAAKSVEVKPASDSESFYIQLTTERVLIDLYKAIVESAISEELARVAAMRLATDNARHLLEQLTVEANRARQISETNALLEIISGFRAVNPEDNA